MASLKSGFLGVIRPLRDGVRPVTATSRRPVGCGGPGRSASLALDWLSAPAETASAAFRIRAKLKSAPASWALNAIDARSRKRRYSMDLFIWARWSTPSKVDPSKLWSATSPATAVWMASRI